MKKKWKWKKGKKSFPGIQKGKALGTRLRLTASLELPAAVRRKSSLPIAKLRSHDRPSDMTELRDNFTLVTLLPATDFPSRLTSRNLKAVSNNSRLLIVCPVYNPPASTDSLWELQEAKTSFQSWKLRGSPHRWSRARSNWSRTSLAEVLQILILKTKDLML